MLFEKSLVTVSDYKMKKEFNSRVFVTNSFLFEDRKLFSLSSSEFSPPDPLNKNFQIQNQTCLTAWEMEMRELLTTNMFEL